MKNTGIISQMKTQKPISLNADKLNHHLNILGFNVVVIDTVDSTNTRLKQALKHHQHKDVLISEEQSAGRGRHNRSFESNKHKGIYCSVVWDLDFNPRQATWFSLMSAYAIAHALEKRTGLSIQIKWPNDLLLDQKKLAGLLIESEINPEQTQIRFVLGFGINVYKQNFSVEIKDRVISLEERVDFLDRNELVIEILKTFNQCLDQPYREDSKEKYNQYLNLPKSLVKIQHNEILYLAQLKGITEEGRMQCIKENGELCELSVEEIHFI